MNEVHNFHARDDLPLSGGEGAIPEKGKVINNKEADDMYVEMKNIYKKYGDFLASNNVSFGVEKGKLVALLGPSGSGKTTLLRMIAGLENPNTGDIYIDGRRVNDIPAAKRGIGFVFQNYALFRYMTVFDNVAFGLELMKVPKKEIKKRVMELLELTGLSGMEKRYPNQLSGGQRQRVAFARALAPNPQVLLLDRALYSRRPHRKRLLGGQAIICRSGEGSGA